MSCAGESVGPVFVAVRFRSGPREARFFVAFVPVVSFAVSRNRRGKWFA